MSRQQNNDPTIENIESSTERFEELADLNCKFRSRTELALAEVENKVNETLGKVLHIKAFIDKCTDLNDEYLRFQKEIANLEGNLNDNSENPNKSETNSDNDEDVIEEAENELNNILASMIGEKCRAPFIQEWGEKAYHNAIILDATHNGDISEKEITVLVMFSNPMCDAMNPCPYFLDGQCKFSDDKCRYSHGYSVKYSELEEYVLPDYSSLTRDSRCLAKYDDGLWHTAIVENCLTNNKYVVKYERYGNVETLSAEDIIPFENLTLSQSNDHDDEEEELENHKYEFTSNKEDIPQANYEVSSSSSALGSWEQHTKGIGSKLMAKMGYVSGQGLGKNSDGRIEPVEAMVLPKGKSLDKCAEIRQNTGPISVEDKFNSEQLKEQKRAKNLDQKNNGNSNESTVFDFINKKVFGNSDNGQKVIRKRDAFSANEETLEHKELNLRAFKIGEDIKKSKKEISKLQHFLKRNTNRNFTACLQMEQKLAFQKTHLRKLENEEKKIEEMSMKKKKMKITF